MEPTESMSPNPEQPTAGRSCPTCGAGKPPVNPQPLSSYIYAIGKIEPRFPRPSIEKELAQAVAKAKTTDLTDRQALAAVLAERENRYLVRQLCWVMTIRGLDTYILRPRDPMDYDLLVQALKPAHEYVDIDVVIGIRDGVAGPEVCNGLVVPIIAFDQIYSFDRASFVKGIPLKDASTDSERLKSSAGELLDRIMHVTDNTGARDSDRALNYVALRYPAIYALAAQSFAANSSLTAVDVRASPLSGVRTVLDVIFSYTNRSTDVIDKHFVRVDVTEEFPFLVTKLSPYYDR